MHPDLELLRTHYDQLAADSRAGHITPGDAFTALSGLSVPDGAGALWKINTEGQFTRAEYPGAPDVVTDAAAFLDPATTAGNPETGQYGGAVSAPTSPTWDLTPPNRAPLGGQADGFATPPPAGGFGTPPPAPGLGHPADTGWPETAAASASPLSTPTDGPPALGRGFGNHHGRSLADAEAAASRAPRLPQVLGWLGAHKMLLVIGLLAVAFLVFKVTGSGTPDGSELPQAADQADQVVAAPPANDPQAKDLPATADVSTVTSAMVSGDRELALSVVQVQPTPAQSAHAAAFFAGLGKAGLTLHPGPLAAGNEATTALQQWEVKSGNETVLVIPVIWAQDDQGAWELQALPVPPSM